MLSRETITFQCKQYIQSSSIDEPNWSEIEMFVKKLIALCSLLISSAEAAVKNLNQIYTLVCIQS